jgi:hypothetical protein
MPGRWTFTATLSPDGSVARWTSPIDAAANGSGSTDAYTSAMSRPNSLRIIVLTLHKKRSDLVEEAEEFVAVTRRKEVEPQCKG